MRASGLVLVAAAGLAGCALGHGDHGGGGAHSQKPVVGEDASWMEKHMAGMSQSNPSFPPTKHLRDTITGPDPRQQPPSPPHRHDRITMPASITREMRSQHIIYMLTLPPLPQ